MVKKILQLSKQLHSNHVNNYVSRYLESKK